MSEEDVPAWHRWRGRVLVAGAGLAAGVVLASTRWNVGMAADTVLERIADFLGHVLVAVPTLMVGAVLYALHRKAALLWGVLICVGVNIAAGVVIQVMGYSLYDREAAYVLLTSIHTSTMPYYAVPMMLLAAYHFRGKLERVRIAAMVLTVLCILTHLGAFFITGNWYSIPYTVIYCALPLALILAAWCLAFRQVPANRPPTDARREVSLVCPRCQVQQVITTGHGECVHCRLQISIALDEGVCGTCGYRRRGLTGDRCPECGEAFGRADDRAGVVVVASDSQK